MVVTEIADNVIVFEFSRGDHWTIKKNMRVRVKMHALPVDIVAAFFGKDTDWLNANMEEEHYCNGRTPRELIVACNDNKVWGWCAFGNEFTESLVHLWYDFNAPYDRIAEDVMEMIAHEQGHLYGTPLTRYAEEEKRAQSYGRIAVIAKKITAVLVHEPTGYENMDWSDLMFALKQHTELLVDLGEAGVHNYSTQIAGMTRELQRRVGME